MVENFILIMDGARQEILDLGLASAEEIDGGIRAFREWMRRPDATMWYATCWAEGERPARGEEGKDATGSALPPREGPGAKERTESAGSEPGGGHGAERDEAATLRFLMDAAAELGSSLELEKVFHRIAQGIRPVLDYHLFCIMLWNEPAQMLEHSFSMKYGQAIPQKGGFPLGYGISGTAALRRQPVRTGNVLEHPDYIRFRHPEVEIRSELAVPLLFRDQLIGVIDLESTEPDYFSDEHERIVSALASHMAVALANARLHEKVVRDEERLERDLSTARGVQRRLLPRARPPIQGVDIGWAYAPARELGGDFFDLLTYGDSRMAIAVGDVSGKATPAALLASLTVGLLRGHVMEHESAPAETLQELNGQLMDAGEAHQFVAMLYSVYDPGKSEIRVANAGIPRPLLLRGGKVEEVPVSGIPLGIFPPARYEETVLAVRPGDLLVFSSDGLLECTNSSGEDFASRRLSSVLAQASGSAREIADRVNREAGEFSGSAEHQTDDYTIVVLRFG
jgi:sigma-B regulation protein RsbU (phosphoserine phosphatase)